MATEWQNEVPREYSLRDTKNSIHVDLGCGYLPRNPLDAERVIGVDVFVDPPYEIVTGKLEYIRVLDEAELPFGSCQIDSVSGFDFLEHIPRVDRAVSGESNSPFIKMMNEIHRILKPGGIFVSLTPCFPSPAAFTDPTHVNFITEETHLYFSGPNFAKTKGYGFNGEFNIIETAWSDWRGFLWDTFARANSDFMISPTKDDNDRKGATKAALKLRLRRKILGHSGETHFLWVLQKPENSE